MPTATKAWAPTPSSVSSSTPTTALKPTCCRATPDSQYDGGPTRDYRRIERPADPGPAVGGQVVRSLQHQAGPHAGHRCQRGGPERLDAANLLRQEPHQHAAVPERIPPGRAPAERRAGKPARRVPPGRLHGRYPAARAASTSDRSLDGVSLGYGWSGGAHTVQLNARHDRDSEFGGKTTGSAAYAFAFTPQWKASTSAGTSFRVAHAVPALQHLRQPRP